MIAKEGEKKMNTKSKLILLIVLVIILAAALILVGVLSAGSEPTPTEAPTAAPTAAPTETPTEAPAPTEEYAPDPVDDPSEPPVVISTEPPVVYTNPLTGEEVSGISDARFFAVSINNSKKALPHVGTGDAAMVFEMFINDHATRCLALFTDIKQVETIGAIRSWRYNFTDIAVAYDAVSAHSGASNEVISDANRNDIDHFNVLNSSQVSYRDSSRISLGYAKVDVLFARGPQLYHYVESKGIRVTRDTEKTYGLNFAQDGTPADGETATQVNLKFTHDGQSKMTTMIYDETLGKYLYTQYGQGITKGNEDYFENVFVILTKVTNKGVYHIADLEGSGDGYYACGGKLIPIQWHHENAEDPFTFTLTDGTPLTQGVGNSYIGICPLTSTITWE